MICVPLEIVTLARLVQKQNALSEMAAIPGVLGFELERDRRAT
jgi:hypothetical protein